MPAQLITGLKSDLLPNHLLHTRRWYYATPLWYYHGAGSRPRLNTDRTFYKLIDRDLLALCLLLHRHGLRTTPSCHGHFYQRRHYERVFRALLRERLRRDAFATPQAAITESPGQKGHAAASLIEITVNAASPDERRRAWDAVTRYLGGLLGALSQRAPLPGAQSQRAPLSGALPSTHELTGPPPRFRHTLAG